MSFPLQVGTFKKENNIGTLWKRVEIESGWQFYIMTADVRRYFKSIV